MAGAKICLIVLSVISLCLTLIGLVFTAIAVGTAQWGIAEVTVDSPIAARGLAAGDVATKNIAGLFSANRYYFPGTQYQIVSTSWYVDHRNDPDLTLPDGTTLSPRQIYQTGIAVFSLNVIALATMLGVLFSTVLILKNYSNSAVWGFFGWTLFTTILQLCAVVVVATVGKYQVGEVAKAMYYITLYPIFRVPTELQFQPGYSGGLAAVSFAIFAFQWIFMSPFMIILTKRVNRARAHVAKTVEKEAAVEGHHEGTPVTVQVINT